MSIASELLADLPLSEAKKHKDLADVQNSVKEVRKSFTSFKKAFADLDELSRDNVQALATKGPASTKAILDDMAKVIQAYEYMLNDNLDAAEVETGLPVKNYWG